MKNAFCVKPLTKYFLLIILLSNLTNCKSNEQTPCIYKGCDAERPTIKNAIHAKGRITTLSGHPEIWIIVSEEGIISENTPIFDGPDIVVICNLADSLKIINQRVIFSGELKDSCNDFEAWTSKVYYSYLTDITINTNDE